MTSPNRCLTERNIRNTRLSLLFSVLDRVNWAVLDTFGQYQTGTVAAVELLETTTGSEKIIGYKEITVLFL